jgi:predicted metal-dependent peptidase
MDINAAKKIKKARIKMFRKDIGLMLFGACSYKFKWVVEEIDPKIEGYVEFNLENPSETSDGIIHINNCFINQPDYTHDNLIALIIHETLHILQKHGSRQRNRNLKFWNFACDHVVDRDLKELKLKPYKDQFNIIRELDIHYPNCSAEEAYDWIMKQKDRFKSQNIEGGNSYEITDTKNNQTFQGIDIPDESSKKNDVDKEKLKNKVDQFVSETRALNQTLKEKSKGNVSGGVQDYLDKLLEVKIDWYKLLEKAIKTNAILKPQERSWKKLNPYYTPHGITLPGMGMEESKENIGTLICMIDSSGSISKTDLKKFAYVLNRSLEYFNKVILLVHDTGIHQIVEFEQDDYSKFYDFVKNIGFKGRGGTSHREVFDYVENEIWSDNEKRDVLSMVISLTDGYSDIERVYKNYNWIKNNTPLTFIINNNSFTFNTDYPEINIIRIN